MTDISSRPPVTQAVVLVGGRGTRLGRLTDTLPKPMLPVGGRPFLDYLLMRLRRRGVQEVILSTGYLAEAVAERYAGQPPFPRPPVRLNGSFRCLPQKANY